jgi:hypothetical protein
MNPLYRALDEYVAIRQGLGVRLTVAARLLRRFVAFVDHAGSELITIDLARRWAMQSNAVQPATWAWRLSMVRSFAQWWRTADSRTEVPPHGLLLHRYHRKPPYIYTELEITAMLAAARALPSPHGLRGLTYATLFGLLVVAGLRLDGTLLSLLVDAADHLRVNRAVVRPDSLQECWGAESAGGEIAGIHRAIVQHDAMRHVVDVVPDNRLACRNGRRVRRKRLRAVDRDDVDGDCIAARWRGTSRVAAVVDIGAAAPNTETERANAKYCCAILHGFFPSVQRLVMAGATLINAAFI